MKVYKVLHNLSARNCVFKNKLQQFDNSNKLFKKLKKMKQKMWILLDQISKIEIKVN